MQFLLWESSEELFAGGSLISLAVFFCFAYWGSIPSVVDRILFPKVYLLIGMWEGGAPDGECFSISNAWMIV